MRRKGVMKSDRVFVPGDISLIELPDGELKVIRLERGRGSQTKYGLIKHDDIIGKPEGSTLKTSIGREVTAFRASIFDLQLYYCERATQVIYPKDSFFMIEYNEIKSGQKVFEAGVGSGFLTMLLACRVAPDGLVYGFDVSERALELSRRNVSLSGCEKNVVLVNHDVRMGIPLTDMDAGFLDISEPWNVIGHAWKALAPGGRLTVFVPTVNQLVKVLKALKSERFRNVRAIEIIHREFEVNPEAIRPKSLQVSHTGYLIFGRKAL